MSMSSRWFKVIVLVVLCGAFTGSAIQSDDSLQPYEQHEKRIRRNKYGAVIMDAQGNRINYTKEQLMAQRASWKGKTQKNEQPPMRPSDMAYAADVKWYYAAFGYDMGNSNIIVSETGTAPEIFLGTSTGSWSDNDYWYALRYDEATGEYVHTFVICEQLFP